MTSATCCLQLSQSLIFCIVVLYVLCISEIIRAEEAVNKSAASAASPDYVKSQAVIKSAASAASPKAKSEKPRSRGAPRGRHPGEAALAADLITA